MKFLTTKCAECNEPKLKDFLFCEKHLKAEYERYFNEEKTQSKHTPTPERPRLREPNKLKFSMALIQAGFTAEFVSYAACAVNSHEAILEAAKNAESLLSAMSAHRDEPSVIYERDSLRKAISQAEGRP